MFPFVVRFLICFKRVCEYCKEFLFFINTINRLLNNYPLKCQRNQNEISFFLTKFREKGRNFVKFSKSSRNFGGKKFHEKFISLVLFVLYCSVDLQSGPLVLICITNPGALGREILQFSDSNLLVRDGSVNIDFKLGMETEQEISCFISKIFCFDFKKIYIVFIHIFMYVY